MRKTAILTSDGRLNTKQHRAADCKLAISHAPVTYKSVSTKEALCFEYLKSFLGQFVALYPKRKLPYMTALNEFGVKKFVCTTIRPSQVPFQELYDLYECASFLAGYILYEPLSPPFEPPEFLFSPTQCLDSHTGDAFDCATLLCSFLTGAGYDAYVVHGYAPKYVTIRDQSSLPCPVITSSSSISSAVHTYANGSGEQPTNDAGAYKPIDNEAKSSIFLKTQEELHQFAKQDSFALWTELPAPERNSDPLSDPPLEKRVHAWVLVRAGHREVKVRTLI